MPTDITTVFACIVLAGLVAALFVYRAEIRRARRRATPPAPVVPLRSSTTYRTTQRRPTAAELRAATVYVLPVTRDRFDADATTVLRVLPGGRDAR